MGRRAKISPKSISDSAIRLVVQEGAPKATMRAISSSMAVNEAALYRHYKSKEELLASAYVGIVEEMAREKAHLAKSTMQFRELVGEWIRLTYTYFDRNPDAFSYVLLVPPPNSVIASGVTKVQGRLFLALIRRAIKKGEIRPIAPKLAFAHFSGVMLSIPRLIREGVLRGPASRYVTEATDAIWRMLGSDTGGD